ncbi:unnamed protein product [Tilletia controversa]|uniref:RING-type domain-containing protein n=2 Tax=Tilletia TaxID=13289 RepID=A0A177UPD7_9BASI|nr:hypothetical protein CF336_g5885 [Tilletia laevis]KAE8191149.1 hypothetical protein CF328_g5769 [Tilletia controversa]KAE8256004.1 hypothetical protein A4X03_0g5478 [Tilletia caries]KAE8193171.1 hypothetical protein CF335_g5660 [Tilletia laevis]CAD6888239.1 unnamed protein product [Tilletia caries]
MSSSAVTVAASFRVHLSLFQSEPASSSEQSSDPAPAPASGLRICPRDIFHPLPAHSDGSEDTAPTDDALALRIRKEQVHVDQRFGPITLDWADNETLLEISRHHTDDMHPSRNAHSRPPHARTPAHLQPQQPPHNVTQSASDTAGTSRSAPVASPSASTSTSASASASAGTPTPTPSSSAARPQTAHPHPHSAATIAAAAESPIPVARYTQQSTFSTDAESESDPDTTAPPDRSAAVSAQASASTYSIGRTHVSFGIVHLFRDQSEADQASSLQHDSQFPALAASSPASSSAVATSSKTLISSTQSSSSSAVTTTTTMPPAGAVQVTTDEEAGSILGILAVPGYMTAADFLAFIEPAADAISHIRMIRELQTEKCMVLIKFRDPSDAEEFHKMYNGQPFNAINEDELCQVVYITSVTVSASYTLPHAYPLLANSDPWPMLPPSSSPSTPSAPVTSSPNTATAAAAATEQRLAAHLTYELPTCPVCLERMDSNVTGLMTVTCQHTFHCACLSKWIDSRCPVCRYSQTRQRNGAAGSSLNSAQSRCTICTTATDLWVCLICASVGCGRYKAGHAQQHFHESGHLYSLELETQRVWDYAGDGYVHRLIQNKADGKLVELPSGSSAASTPVRGGGQRNIRGAGGTAESEDMSFPGGSGKGGSSHRMMLGGAGGSDPEDKVESLGLEYSYLIASQLESQRSFYEEQVRLLQAELESSQHAQAQSRDRLHEAEGALASIQLRLGEMEVSQARLGQERDRAEKRAEKALELMRKHERDLHTERSQTAGLMKNLSAIRTERASVESELNALKAEMTDVREQMRDLMFFVSARDKVEGDEELVGGDVVGVPAQQGKGGSGASAGVGAGATATGVGGASKKNKKKSKKPSSGVVAQLAAAQQQQRQSSGSGSGGGGEGADGHEDAVAGEPS